MIQIYFLSVLVNIVAGVALSARLLGEKLPSLSRVPLFFEFRPGLRVTLGIVAMVVGVLKLLSVTYGDVPVVGDLLPALTGLAVGAALLFERYKEKSTVESEATAAAQKLLLNNRNILGIVSILVGIVHFVMPSVLFL